MTVEAVGDQQSVVDIEDRYGRQTLPGVGVALDREIIEAVAQVEVGVENEVVEGYFANFHCGDSFVVSAQARAQRWFQFRLCRPMIGSGSRRLASTFSD